jgi:hypothetical protein
MTRSKRRGSDTSHDGEVWAKIISHKSSYYISRDAVGDDQYRVHDEAQLEIIGTIDAIAPRQRKHLGEQLLVSLIAAEKYEPKEPASVPFFGSVNFRGSQRSAFAYLPSKPFWALPDLIGNRGAWICVGWKSLHRGYAQLDSVFIGDAGDRGHLLGLSGNWLVT